MIGWMTLAATRVRRQDAGQANCLVWGIWTPQPARQPDARRRLIIRIRTHQRVVTSCVRVGPKPAEREERDFCLSCLGCWRGRSADPKLRRGEKPLFLHLGVSKWRSGRVPLPLYIAPPTAIDIEGREGSQPRSLSHTVLSHSHTQHTVPRPLQRPLRSVSLALVCSRISASTAIDRLFGRSIASNRSIWKADNLISSTDCKSRRTAGLIGAFKLLIDCDGSIKNRSRTLQDIHKPALHFPHKQAHVLLLRPGPLPLDAALSLLLQRQRQPLLVPLRLRE